MFDSVLPELSALRDLDDAALIDAVTGYNRAAAAAEARKLTAIAELLQRRIAAEPHSRWAFDDIDATAAELSCALTISHGRALGQIDLAVALRDRVPQVGQRFLAGDIDLRAVTTIMRRTFLVTDPDTLRALDSALADCATSWGPLSQAKLEQAIDVWIEKFDPDAIHRLRNSTRDRNFTVGDPNDTTGTTSVYGRLTSTDAALLNQCVAVMAAGVCQDDPRTLEQRRADALGALAARATHLACRCGNPDCPATADDGRASSIVIHLIAEQQALTHPVDPSFDGDDPAPPKPPTQPRRPAGLIPGVQGGVVPAPLLADLIAHGATVRTITAPDHGPEPRYRPSAALQKFIRNRDLTCRFPGCDRPAIRTDIDHTIPWPAGPTHPSNTTCRCRGHHLLKTFWQGWTEQQLPDGTLHITTPTGHTYTTKPFSTLLFPTWKTGTAPLLPTAPLPPTAPVAPDDTHRNLKMPTRRQTRAQTRQRRINAERALNAAQHAQPPPY